MPALDYPPQQKKTRETEKGLHKQARTRIPAPYVLPLVVSVWFRFLGPSERGLAFFHSVFFAGLLINRGNLVFSPVDFESEKVACSGLFRGLFSFFQFIHKLKRFK